jgi:hypothetical protein
MAQGFVFLENTRISFQVLTVVTLQMVVFWVSKIQSPNK